MQLTPIRQAESKYLQSNFTNPVQSVKSQNSGQGSSQSKAINSPNSKLVSSTITLLQHYDSLDPIQIQCENCHTFSSSLVYVESTNYTYIAALILTLLCLCWVPFVLKKYFMKISHNCPGCDRLVGEYDFLAQKMQQ